jgi:uracil-DNA glycosylase family protein
MRTVEIEPTFEAWQAAARALLAEGVPPEQVRWRVAPAAPPLLAPPAPGTGVARVPRRFLELARDAATHRDPGRWQLLYEVLWRLTTEDRELLRATGDPQVRRLVALALQAREAAERAEVSPGAGAAAFVPAGAALPQLKVAARGCTGCELYRQATQTVFGQGPADARVVLVGEQPGDQEDLKGAPFVGPAGAVLDRALGEVGLRRERLYVTNAVKHFKFVERGKRRIHQTPRLSELTACRPWLEAELGLVRPEVLVALGATAARAIFGPDFRLLQNRGRFVETRWTPKSLATIHPSAVLRGDDEAAQARLYDMLVEDLRLAAAAA